MNKLKFSKFHLFLILIIFMPMHTLLFSYMLGNIKILSLWRDFIILYLFLVSFRRKLKRNVINIYILFSAFIIVIYAFMALGITSFNIARTYVMPLLIYFYTSSEVFDDYKLRIIFKTCLITTTLIAAWGLFQAYVLGPQILYDLGYSNSYGRFSSSSFYIAGWNQQRVVGTFSSPNGCGAYFAVMLVFLTSMKKYAEKYLKIYWFCLACIFLGLIATFSRSAWLGCFFGILLFNKHSISIKKRNAKILIATLIIIIPLLGVFYSSNSMVATVFDMMANHITRTVSKEDASFLYHLIELYKPLNMALLHPLGLGFGTNGSFALAYLDLEKTHQVESSIWLMAYEVGILGMIVYYIPYLASIVRYCSKRYNNIIRNSAKVTICILVIFCVLPSVQSYEQPFFAMMFAGIAESQCRWKNI